MPGIMSPLDSVMRPSGASELPVALSVHHLHVRYNAHLVLSHVDINITAGSLVAIVGPNGAGKSTLVKACLGLIPFEGEIYLLGGTLDRVRGQVAYLPQREKVDWGFPIDVESLVLMGRYPHLGWWGFTTAQDRQLVEDALDEVGLLPVRHQLIGSLSGGQQQRAFLARALVQQPNLYFMDEPFSAVDQKTEQRLVKVMKEHARRGSTFLVVHHNLHTLHQYFDWIILLNQKLILSAPLSEVTLPEIIAKAYGG